MSKVPKISELSKMVRNDIIKQFLRKSIVKNENGLFMSKISKLTQTERNVKNIVCEHKIVKKGELDAK